MTGNAEATPHAAGESVEAIRRGSDELEHSHTDCADARQPASTNVINTPCEAMFHQALIRARLSFETQSHPAGDRYEADIELKQKPIVIEVTNSPGEKRAAPRRKRKAESLQAAGYRVYWFSNHQARTDPDAAVRQVMRENGLTSEVAPEVLIRANRTGHVGALNPNWGGGKPVTVCEQCGATVTLPKRPNGKPARFCNSECYGKWLHEHPEEVKSKRLSLDWDEVARVYATGMSCEQVGEHFGCSTSAVKVNLRKRGVLRPTGGARVAGGFYAASVTPGS